VKVQHATNGGKCGVCGDVYTAPHPQPNENTGKYGQGIIAAEYSAGSVIDVEVLLTTNHKGQFSFRYFLELPLTGHLTDNFFDAVCASWKIPTPQNPERVASSL
jgi:hypothetical protein